MADVTKSVIAGGGGDYTTITAAEAASDVSTGWYKIEIQDNSTYTEAVNISGSTGTDSATNYVWLTAASANRHNGSFSGSHCRLHQTGSLTCLTVSDSYARIDWLHFYRTSVGITDAGIMSVQADNAVVSKCMFGDHFAAGVRDSGWSVFGGASGLRTVSIDNCVTVGAGGTGVQLQSTSGGDLTVNMDHCSFARNGASTASEPASGVYIYTWSNTATPTAILNIYNNAASGPNSVSQFDWTFQSGGFATLTLNGSNNLTETGVSLLGSVVVNNTTSWQTASSGIATVSKTSGSWWVVLVDADADTGDLRLLDEEAGNLAANNGINRIGSEPDSRQDFSIDIAGNTRDTTSVDIGAYVFVAAALDGGWGRIPCF